MPHRALVRFQRNAAADDAVRNCHTDATGATARAHHDGLSQSWQEYTFAQFHDNASAIHVLAICDMLGEGYDFAPVSLIGFAAKTTFNRFYQLLGRALRLTHPAEGDDMNAWILTTSELHPYFERQLVMLSNESFVLDADISTADDDTGANAGNDSDVDSTAVHDDD